jgi:hypothetical protein
MQAPRSATSPPQSTISKPLAIDGRGQGECQLKFSPNKKLIRNVKIHLINAAGCRSIHATSKNQ